MTEPVDNAWNADPNGASAWCPKCRGPMTEAGCFKGPACSPDDGKFHAFDIALAPGGPTT